MSRQVGLLAILVAAFCWAATAAAGATNEIRPCGTSQGWEVNAGNFPPKLPQTKCSFARATDRALKEYERAKGSLPNPLDLTINGQGITCRSKSARGYAEIRCRNPQRFVLIYRFS